MHGKLISDYGSMRDGTAKGVGGKPKVWRNGQTFALSWAFNYAERKACNRGRMMVALASPKVRTFGLR